MSPGIGTDNGVPAGGITGGQTGTGLTFEDAQARIDKIKKTDEFSTILNNASIASLKTQADNADKLSEANSVFKGIKGLTDMQNNLIGTLQQTMSGLGRS